MEPIGAFLGEEWDSLSKMFSSEDADDHFMLQYLNGENMFANNSCDGSLFFATPSIFWPLNEGNENVAGVDGALLYSDTVDHHYTNFHNVSQESSNTSSASDGFYPNPSHEFYLTNEINHLQVTSNTPKSTHFCVVDDKNNNLVPVFPNAVMGDIICTRDQEMGNDKFANVQSQQQPANIAASGNDELLLKRKFESSDEVEAEDKSNDSENPKKKPRVPRTVQKGKRNVQTKTRKNQKTCQVNNVDEEEANVTQNGQSSSCYNSEDDSNASQESNGGATSDTKGAALNLNGKTRANRGSATDQQSLYARRRRERINERLRILQNLIPNGTKVDISTMLEEAVHYVKFLQLQIKLLSSDDLWMYAPIIYNGLDTGLYGKLFPNL